MFSEPRGKSKFFTEEGIWLRPEEGMRCARQKLLKFKSAQGSFLEETTPPPSLIPLGPWGLLGAPLVPRAGPSESPCVYCKSNQPRLLPLLWDLEPPELQKPKAPGAFCSHPENHTWEQRQVWWHSSNICSVCEARSAPGLTHLIRQQRLLFA